MARPTTHPIKKVLSLTPEQAERIREYRFEQRIESENEAIRQLIEAGLNGGEKPSTRKAKRGSIG